jgi:hypothetical protein
MLEKFHIGVIGETNVVCESSNNYCQMYEYKCIPPEYMNQVYFSFSTDIDVDIESFHKTDVSSTVLATLVHSLTWRFYQ